MLVEAVKYFINTDMKTIKADISEYNRLSKKCEQLKKMAGIKYRALSGSKGCIAHKIRTQVIGVSDVNLLEYEQETFSECRNLTNSLCVYNSCPFFDRNRNYIAALNNYSDAIQNKKSYWSKKFMRVK